MTSDHRPDALSVTAVNRYIKELLEGDAMLSEVWVRGEISGGKDYASGHFYFSLKDEESVISGVMFRPARSRLRFSPENGMKVLVAGHLSAYVPRGQYQLIAEAMLPDGVGELAIAFEQLKARLGAEGLFDPDRKKPLPPHPHRIGIITSPSGAAVHDIIRVARGRCPSTELLLFPSPVQGAEAPGYLAAGIRYFNSMRDDPEQGVDLIIIGRGGGSAEDLWAFNDERLARAVAASAIPVVSAVGHEVDFSICDFVADLRAATPSAAAELSLPDRADLARRVAALATRLETAQATRLRALATRLERLSAARVLTSPEGALRPRREALENLASRLDRTADRRTAEGRQTLARLAAGLNALSPLAVLGRGYTLVEDDAGHVVPSTGALSVDESVTLRFADGAARARITAITPTLTQKEAPAYD